MKKHMKTELEGSVANRTEERSKYDFSRYGSEDPDPNHYDTDPKATYLKLLPA